MNIDRLINRMFAEEEEIFTEIEAAECLGMDLGGFRRAMKRERIPCRSYNGEVCILEEDLEEYLRIENQTVYSAYFQPRGDHRKYGTGR